MNDEDSYLPKVLGKGSVFASGEGLLPPKEKGYLAIDPSYYPNLKLVTKISEPETMHSVDLKPLQVGEVAEPLTKVESTVGNPVVSYRYGKADLRFRTQEEAKKYATAFCLESGLDLVSKVEECPGREANAALTWKDPNKDWVYVSGDGLLPDREYTPITVCYLYEIEAYHKGMRILRSNKDVGEATSLGEVKPTLSFVGKGGARFRTKEEAELWGGTKGKVRGSQEGLNSILVWEEDGVTYGSGKGLLPKGLDYSCVAASEPDYDNMSYMDDSRHIFFEPPKSWGRAGDSARFATREEADLASPGDKIQPSEFGPNRVLVWEAGGAIWLSGSGFLPKVGYNTLAHQDLHQFARDTTNTSPRSTFDLGVSTGQFKGNVDLLKIRSYSVRAWARELRFGTREEAEFWVDQKSPEDWRILTSPLEANVYFKWGDEAEQNSKDGHHLPPKDMPCGVIHIPGSDLVYKPHKVLSAKEDTPSEPSEEAVCADVAAKVDSVETLALPAADIVKDLPVHRPEESEIRSYVLTTHDVQSNENKGALPITFRLQTRELAELWQKTGTESSWSFEPSSLEPNSVLLWRTKEGDGYQASNDPIGRASETVYPDQDAHSYALVRKSVIHFDQGSKYYRGVPVVYVPPGAPVEKESPIPLLGFLGALGLMHGVLKGINSSSLGKRVAAPKPVDVVVEPEVLVDECVEKGLRS